MAVGLPGDSCCHEKSNLMPKILITGSNGLLGSTFVPLLDLPEYEVKTHARSGSANFYADLSVRQDTYDLLDQAQPDVIVNLVGLTDVDRCEAEPNSAYLTNVRTVHNIVSWVKTTGRQCHIVQISTDHVYDGNLPHLEEEMQLTNYYAFSKYAGELAAANIPSTILRTNFFGRSQCEKKQGLTDWLFRALSNDESIQVFDDVLFSPLSMTTLAKLMNLVLQVKPIGVFNLGSRNGMSKADFAFTFAGELGLPTKSMMRVRSDQVTFRSTYRPKDMRMDSSKFEKRFGIDLPSLEREIGVVAREYHEKA